MELFGTVPVLDLVEELLLPMIVGGLGIVAAFVVCCVHSMGKWKVRKDVILYVIEGGYLLYTGAVMWLNLDPCYSCLKGYFDSGDPSREGYVDVSYRRWAMNL